MAIDVHVSDDRVDLAFSGIDQLMCFATSVAVPMADIVSARVATVEEAKADLSWRTRGAYWPGWFATGWYKVEGRPGDRQLWAVYRDREVLVIDTRLARPRRIVVQHPDRHDLAWYIGERLPASR